MSEPHFPPSTLLGRIGPRSCTALLKLGVVRSLPTGTTIIREGDDESFVVLLHDALVKVSAHIADGRQALLSIRVSGDLVGEISALNGTPRTATVVTCAPSKVGIIHQAEFRAVLRQDADVAVAVAAIAADRWRRATRIRVDFNSYPVKVRLARILVELAESYGQRELSGVTLSVSLTQPELAGLCNAAEVTLQKALSELRSAGLVGTGYRRLVVRDVDALRRIGESG
jgi:CRP/FNR family transcriptional regulator, cyclic AMP receptor protein